MTDNYIFYNPADFANIEIKQSPFAFTIQNHDGKMMVSVGYDGTLTYGDSYTPDAAAKIFWEAIGHTAPMKRIRELEAALKPFTETDYTGSPPQITETQYRAARAAYLGEKDEAVSAPEGAAG